MTTTGYTDIGNVDAGDTIDPAYGDQIRTNLNLHDGFFVLGGYAKFASSAPVVINNTTTETNMFSYTVPGGTLGTTGILRYRLSGYLAASNTVGDNTVTFKLYYGSTSISFTGQVDGSDTDGTDFDMWGEVVGTGATNTQWLKAAGISESTEWRGVNGQGINSAFDSSVAEDSTGDLAFKLTATMSAAADGQKVVAAYYIGWLAQG